MISVGSTIGLIAIAILIAIGWIIKEQKISDEIDELEKELENDSEND